MAKKKSYGNESITALKGAERVRRAAWRYFRLRRARRLPACCL